MSDAARMGSPAPGHQFVDLHMHSTASDGSRAPKDVVAAAVAANLAAIALTDHDTLAGLAEASAAGNVAGIRVIPGIELSAVEGDRAEHETHVLGLHITQKSELEERLVAIRAMRVNRGERMVARLNELGVPITMAAVLKEAAGGAVGRPHVARALVAGGWVSDSKAAFERFIGAGRPAFVSKDRLSIADAIGLIHRAGGLAILAHPGSSLSRERVTELVTAGLDGLEVLHPGHTWDEAERLDALAAEFKLARSGGSDWHGAADGARTIGMMRVPSTWLEEQDARVAANASRRVA